MTQTPSFRDVEKLSAYLDGQLKVSEIARLEARLQTEPELASALKNLREARGVLRGLPQRRAPRNFILTPKMVGSKPPMPRSYPVFRFATVLATLFLFLTFATNFIAPRLVRTAAPYPYGLGGYGGGGGGEESEMQMEATESMEEPAEEPAMEEPAAAEPAPAEGEPAPTMMSTPAALAEEESTAEDSMRTEGTAQPNAVEKSGPGENYAQDLTPEPDEATQAKSAPPIGITTQITLAGIAALCAIIALILRYNTIRKWRVKAK